MSQLIIISFEIVLEFVMLAW